MRDLSGRQLALILALGVAAFAALLVRFVVMPQVNSYRAELKVEATLREIVESDGELDSQLSKIGSETELLRRRLSGDMASLPEKEIEAYVVGSLQRLSWENSVQLVSIEPAAGRTIEPFHELLFEVKLAGDYFDIYHWLQEVSSELGFVLIKRYEMKAIRSTARKPRLSVTLTMATYRAST